MNPENGNSNKDLYSINNHILMFIDANNLISQCYHASKTIGSEVWNTTLFLFMKRVFQFRSMHDKAILVFFFDSDHSYRNDIYPWYKAHIKERYENEEESLKHKIINKLRLDIIPALGFQTSHQEGVEADDLIAAYCTDNLKRCKKILIFSSDEDLFQLAKVRVHFYNSVKDKLFTKKEITEKFGIKPSNMAIRKALIGKKGEIPGFPGIGKKTATRIINEEIPFPKIDMDLFGQYLNASIIPFFNPEDRVIVNKVKRFHGKQKDFRKVFSENSMEFFLKIVNFNQWVNTFKLR